MARHLRDEAAIVVMKGLTKIAKGGEYFWLCLSLLHRAIMEYSVVRRRFQKLMRGQLQTLQKASCPPHLSLFEEFQTSEYLLVSLTQE